MASTYFEKIGSGAHGAVYSIPRAANVATTQDRVAAKMFTDVSVFQTELACARLCCGHPNLVRVLGANSNWAQDGRWRGWLIMELAFTDLFNYIADNGPVCARMQTTLIHQMLQGVHHMHSKNVAHMDLKLENCLIARKYDPSSPHRDDEGFTMLVQWADFSFAHIVVDGSSCMRTGVRGSMAYVAPEVIQNKSKYDVFSADMWSLGVTSYALLGSLPWGSATASDGHFKEFLLGRHRVFSIISGTDGDYSQAMTRILGATLVSEPTLRMSSGDAMIGVTVG